MVARAPRVWLSSHGAMANDPMVVPDNYSLRMMTVGGAAPAATPSPTPASGVTDANAVLEDLLESARVAIERDGRVKTNRHLD